MSFTHVGKVVKTFISDIQSASKQEKTSIHLDALGIINDKYYDTNPNRSVLITATTSYQLAQKHDIQIAFGTLGENILIDYNLYHLCAGERVSIGEVILEITQNCTICEHLSTFDKKLPTLLKSDRGIFAKVVQAGEIKKEDAVFISSSKV